MVYNTVNKTIDRTGGGTATLSYTIRSSNGRDEDITRHNMYYSEDNINEKSIDELYNVLDILKHNGVHRLSYPGHQHVRRYHAGLCKSATIVDASAAPVAKGSPLTRSISRSKLHPYREVDEVKTMSFNVLKNQPLGDMVLEVRGGRHSSAVPHRKTALQPD